MDSTLIYNARTAAYVAVWNASQGSPVPRAIPLAMNAAREAVGAVHVNEHLLRAAAWDAIWTVAGGRERLFVLGNPVYADWAAGHFRIVNNIRDIACLVMANFNVLEYIQCAGALYAIARAAAWRRIIDVRTYDAWVEAYELCLQQAREVLSNGDHQ